MKVTKQALAYSQSPETDGSVMHLRPRLEGLCFFCCYLHESKFDAFTFLTPNKCRHGIKPATRSFLLACLGYVLFTARLQEKIPGILVGGQHEITTPAEWTLSLVYTRHHVKSFNNLYEHAFVVCASVLFACCGHVITIS